MRNVKLNHKRISIETQLKMQLLINILSLRDEASPGESLLRLLKGCPNLKKLFLAAIRGLTDRDLENIANLCPNLEQLDLLGVMGISTEKCYL